MLFNSYYFILYFLPVVLLCYYCAHKFGLHKVALAVLSIASFVFYAYDNIYYLALLAGSILVNWLVAYLINRQKGSEVPIKKVLMIAGIVIDVAVIFVFKYYDFFIENMNALFKADFNLRHIILPLGISFFTFQQISYLVDTYRGETADYSFIEYVAFVSFFPQLVAGPIVLHSELITQYRDESRWKISSENFANGLYVFAMGLFKKVIIADKFGQVVTWGWADISSRTSMDMFLVMLFYTFQLYFDFSGYCDMAIGIARLFNLELPVNFNSPYKAVSINDFWKRWHMTLTRFLTNYIYIPLGGNRKGKVRTYINIMIVFLISGIWHGANWTFILWGVLHGILQVLNRLFKKLWDKLPKWIAWLCTFLVVNLLWVMFYAHNVGEGFTVWVRILSFDSFKISADIPLLFVMNDISMLLGMLGPIGALSVTYYQWYMVVYIILAFVVCLCCKNLHEEPFKPTLGKAIMSALLMIWAVISFSGVSTFLYFNF
ncbi:MAG: MBOAT family protein [Lachnospiraceae bacterium]|nr:MBOAT family protein [Candidatus Colinaster scatohippi]